MAQLTIRGHRTRGNEVIALLETLGGKNIHFYSSKRQTCIYFIGNDNDIQMLHLSLTGENFVVFTLEEFEAKFPYKVGDMVRIYDFESKVRINNMKWDGSKIQYEVFTDESEWYSSEELNECN